VSSYIQLSFKNLDADLQAILIAQLSEAGFEGFEENDAELKAFIPASIINRQLLNGLSSKYRLQYEERELPEQNWNDVWESNFEPVVVDDFAGIRASFHAPLDHVQHEIVITPKMSFGTGHHATTWLMMQQMREISFHKATVLDFGTGTGILAILAEKLGAEKIIAIDNDDWSMANAAENMLANDMQRIQLLKADTPATGSLYDIILANINKNIILVHLHTLAKELKKEGNLLLSGLLVTDEEEIVTACRNYSLLLCKRTEKNNWICLQFSY
jgi:ribosomal protein L11 methyltransferase